MDIKILGSELKLTVISFVNGILVGIDDTVDELYCDEDLDNGNDDNKPKKRPKKNPEDNLGDAVGFLDTDKIERGVDFITIKEEIDELRKRNGWSMVDFFKHDDILADFCHHYDYTLPNFIRLMVEHMPEEVNLHFLRTTVRPAIAALQKLKNDYMEKEDLNGENGIYRRIFAYI